jgi:acyl carrier protein
MIMAAEQKNDLEAEITEFLQEYLELGKFDANDDLFETVGLDSMQTTELVIFLEERYSVKVHPRLITQDNFRTVKRISELVRSL